MRAKSGADVSLGVQTFHTGALSSEYKRQLASLESNQTVPRFWKRDLSLWPFYSPPKDHGKSLLNWLGLADQIAPGIAKISQLGDALEGKGFTDVVFLAVSSSSLAAEIIPSLSLETRGAKFHVLSLMEPSGLRALERQIDFQRTVFLIASKSGKNLELHSLLLYLLSKVKSSGLPVPAGNFIAITEEGSYLATLAHENRFRALFAEPHGFRGRFSGLVHYGNLLAGLCKFDASTIVSRAQEMRELCMPRTPLEQNPAAQLAAFLAAMATSGFPRFVLRAPPPLVPFAQRIAHLVGSSTCKLEKGIMPFIEADIAAPEILDRSCALCDIQLGNETVFAPSAPGVPSITIQLGAIENIPAEIFKWEVATCLASSILGVNPFEDPDFTDSRNAAIQHVERASAGKKIGDSLPRIVESSLSLFVEGELRQEISTLNLEQALSSFFALRNDNAYVAILNYSWNMPESKARLASIARQIGEELFLPVQLVTGPWYVHLLGQCYKGGPRGGIFLLITCDASERIEVPGAGYTFGDLVHALALGDLEALNSRRRPVVRLHLSGKPEQSLAELETTVGRALRAVRRTR